MLFSNLYTTVLVDLDLNVGEEIVRLPLDVLRQVTP